MLRQQIELDECDAYDQLIAKHAAKVEQISDDLAQRQVGEMQRFIEATRRVDEMAPRIVRMCDVSAKEVVYNDRYGPTLTDEEREDLLEMASDPIRIAEQPDRMAHLRDVALAKPGSPLRVRPMEQPFRHAVKQERFNQRSSSKSPTRTQGNVGDRKLPQSQMRLLARNYEPHYKTVRALSPGRQVGAEVNQEELVKDLLEPMFRRVLLGDI